MKKAFCLVAVLVMSLVACNKNDVPSDESNSFQNALSNLDKSALKIETFLLGEPTLDISPLMQKQELPPWDFDYPPAPPLCNFTPKELEGIGKIYKWNFYTYFEYKKNIYLLDGDYCYGGYGAAQFAHVQNDEFNALFYVAGHGSGHHSVNVLVFDLNTKKTYVVEERFDTPNSYDETTNKVVEFMFVLENNSLNLYQGFFDMEWQQMTETENGQTLKITAIHHVSLRVNDIFTLEYIPIEYKAN